MREECPHCGAELKPGARVCPECGSDEMTGWSEEARASELGLPGDSFDYDEFVKREFSQGDPEKGRLHWFWWLIAVLVVAGVAWFAIR